jgi:ribonuclease HI
MLNTDRPCSNPGGRGGWAWIAVADDQETAHGYGHDPETTHQRMEIRAAIEAVSSRAPGESAVVHSDSAYVVNCFRQRWHEKWERNGWRTPIRSLSRTTISGAS